VETISVKDSHQQQGWVLSPRVFDALLNWLDQGINSSGKTYLEMQRRLVFYFDRKNCSTPDELATLREAIVAANANAGPDVIGFSVTGTINLTGALPPITDALAINGPGAAQLTVRRDTGGDYRIFALMVNAPSVVTISGLNITNGLASGSFPDAG